MAMPSAAAGEAADQARKHEIDVSTQGRGRSLLMPGLGGGAGGSLGTGALDIALSEPFVITIDEHGCPSIGDRLIARPHKGSVVDYCAVKVKRPDAAAPDRSEHAPRAPLSRRPGPQTARPRCVAGRGRGGA